MGPEEVEIRVQDSGIIRHRGKIQAIITNAQAYLAMEANGEDFSRFIWSFVDDEPKLTIGGVWQKPRQQPPSLMPCLRP